jgi:outer membrane protein OmpA-like peptidoglycan-associated protein
MEAHFSRERTQRLLRVALLGITAAAVALSGCTVGSKLRAKSTEIDELTSNIRDRAYRCSPKELAIAESNAKFGSYELDAGNFVRADEHLAKAYESAQIADVNSRGPECQEIAVLVQADKDGDGILDKNDKCPDDPEDFDGFEDLDGCPEDQDTDGDGIPDSKDMCPTEPGLAENQGCPKVIADKDGDGINDDLDKCPLDPEDIDAFEDEDGCPDKDNDNDGILDLQDKCPMEPEDRDQFEDEDGCPDFDNDQDQILDVNDKCPNEPEDYDGDADEDGCKDEFKLVVVKDDRIEIKQKIFFATGKSKILSKSFAVLNEVALVMNKRGTLRVRVEGHTDNVGPARRNQRLSEARAGSVRKYLVSRGIDPTRLVPVGYGEDRPIEDNGTPAGREINRRVEFHIISK